MLDRTWAINYIEDNYATIARKARVDSTDTPTGYKGILDKTFKALGVDNASLSTASIEDEKQDSLQALLDYYSLYKFYTNFSVFTDTTFTNPGINSKKSQLFKNIEQLLNKAKGVVTALGFIVEGINESDYKFVELYYNF